MRTLIISLVLFAIVIYLAQGESIRFGQVNVNTEEGNLLDHLMDVNRVMHRRIREDFDIDRPLQFLVNMKGNVRAHQVEDLLGKKLAHFIPPKSFVVYASPLSIAKALSSSKVKAKDLINWIGYVKPAFKSPLKIDPASLLNKNGVDLIVILTSDSSTTAAILHHLLLNRFKQGVNIHYTSDGLLRVHADVHIAGKVLDWLKEREEVHWIERSRTMKLFNNAANIIVQGNGNFTLDPVGKPLWDRNLTGEGEIVAVTDSGLDYDNCFFYDPGQTVELNTVNFNHRKVVGYFTAREGTEFGDGRDSINGHGTHVCGSVAGSMYSGAPNTEELEEFAGVAKGAKLFFQDASVPENPSSISYGDIYALFEQSYTVGNARIHSNSFGCGAFKCEFDCVCYVEDEEGNDIVIPNSNCTEAYGTDCCKVCNDYTVDSARADKFLYEHNDMIILFSAGNNGEYTYNGTVGSPGLAKNVLTVGASKTTNSNFLVSTNYQDPAMFGVSSQLACCLERIFPCCPALAEQVYSDTNVYNHSNLASFSSRGPTSDQRNKPDLVAPGQWVVSMHSDGRLNTNQCGTQRPEGANNAALIAMQGTSMSCPVTAGAAAIVRQYYRDTGRYSNPSGPLLKATLINSATPLPGTVSIDGSRTLTVDLPKETPNLYEGYGLVSLSNVLQFEDSEFQLYTFDMINITEGESHTYLFASNSTTGTSQLKVTLAWYDLPSSVVSKGFLVNDLDLTVGYFNGTDVTALGNGIEDHLNNVEQVVLVDIEPGSPLNITVTGFKLQTEQQSYALVITGKDITDQIAEASTS